MKARQFDSVVESKKVLEEMVETFGNVSDDTMERLEIVDEQLLKFLNASELYSKSKYSLRYWFGWEVDEVYEYGKFLYKFNADGVLVRRDKFADVYFNMAARSSSFLENLKEHAVPVDSDSGRVKDYIIADLDDVKDILSKLRARAITHGVATIADYYDMIGVEAQEFADYEYGWAIRDIPHMEIKASNGGWCINFPKVRSIE